jgi:hypothetical protein
MTAPDTGTIWVQESWINKDTGMCYGDSEVYDTGIPQNQVGELFRRCQSEYGRCVSRIYIDSKNGSNQPRTIGWVFEKRVEYQNAAPESYIQETWVTLHSAPPTKNIQHHYFPL